MSNTTGGATAEPAGAASEQAAFWRGLDRDRGRYYTLLCALIIANVLYVMARVAEWRLTPFLTADLAAAIAFLALFLRTAKRAGFPVWMLVLTGVLIMLPLGIVPTIAVLVADNKVGKLIGEGLKRADPEAYRALTEPARGTLSPLAYWSLILGLIPLFGWAGGLPLSIIALRKIRRSQGRVRGAGWAWAGGVVSAISLLFTIVMLLRPASVP